MQILNIKKQTNDPSKGCECVANALYDTRVCTRYNLKFIRFVCWGYIYIYIYIYIYVCVCVYMYMYIHIYIYI